MGGREGEREREAGRKGTERSLVISHLSHLEGSSTSVGRPGNCQSPVLAVENVDVRQSILLDISLDGIHVSQFRSSSRSHTFYLHVQHCLIEAW